MKYEGVVSLSHQDARDIVDTIWPAAPAPERKKAMLLCVQYGLNPLMNHLFLLPFKNKVTGKYDWAVVMGIKATRLIASRRGRYGYVDDTPRLMNEAEELKIYGEVDSRFLRAITILKDQAGNIAPGYGAWPKDTVPYGVDKGNTKANMAFIRSERAALDRLYPGEMPQGVDVVSEEYLPKITDITPGPEEKETKPAGDPPPEATQGGIIEAEIIKEKAAPPPPPPPGRSLSETKTAGAQKTTAAEPPAEVESQRVDFIQWVLQNKPELKNEKTVREWLVNVVKIAPGLIDTNPQACYKPVVDVTGWSL